MVTVILFSDLFGSFADEKGSWNACEKAYQEMRRAGVELIFMTGAPLDAARDVLAGLDPEAAVVADGGNAIAAPEGHPLGVGGDFPARLNHELHRQRAAAEWAIERFGSQGRIVITFGVGDSADDGFLQAVEVAALIPGGNGKVCPLIPRPRVTYECGRPGQAGWNEWAELMLRRVEIISGKD